MKLLIITQKVDENDQLLGFFIEWLKRFARKFDKLTVLCLEKGKYELPSNMKVISLGKEKFENLGIKNSLKIKNWKLKILRRILYSFRFFRYIWQMRREYDAVFIHMNPIWVVLGGWWWRLTGKKIFFWYTSGGVTFKLKLAEKFADVIFTASKESFRVPSKKVIVTGHGIDTELFRPISAFRPAFRTGRHFDIIRDTRSDLVSKLKILSIGRIAPVKNYETLVEAAKILKNEDFEFKVSLVGKPALEEDKQYENKLKLLITSYQLQDYFNFVGKVDHNDLPGYYQSHNLFVHLSKTGSLDKTILEAMACGMSVLSSSDTARNFLPAELLFDENNSWELADKIKKTHEKEVSGQLRQYVIENHNLDDLINKITKTING